MKIQSPSLVLKNMNYISMEEKTPLRYYNIPTDRWMGGWVHPLCWKICPFSSTRSRDENSEPIPCAEKYELYLDGGKNTFKILQLTY